MRGVGDPEPLRGEVLPAAVGIEDLGRERIVTDGIDAKVAPAGGGREIEARGDLDGESPMSGPRLVVAPGQREIGVEPVDAKDAEGPPDRSGSSEAPEDRFDPFEGEPEHLDVHVGRGTAEEPVAYLSSDEERTAARFVDRLRDLAEARVHVAEVGPGRERRSLHRSVRGHEGIRREAGLRTFRGHAMTGRPASEPPGPATDRRRRPARPAPGAQPASIRIRLSWNAAPPTGAAGSAPVSALMPTPSGNALFGQMLSTITTPR